MFRFIQIRDAYNTDGEFLFLLLAPVKHKGCVARSVKNNKNICKKKQPIELTVTDTEKYPDL